MKTELEHLGRRLDAVVVAGHKGSHANVNKEEASRFVVGAYMLIGDILHLDTTTRKEQHNNI